MKYKAIPAALHNFAHSFVSLSNYVDGQYLIDVVPGVLADAPSGRITIVFPGRRIEPSGSYPVSLVKSVEYWADALPKHLESHGISATTLGDIRVIMERWAGTWRCLVEATDDRGRSYSVPVVHA